MRWDIPIFQVLRKLKSRLLRREVELVTLALRMLLPA